MKEQFIRVTEEGDRFYYKDYEMRTLHREDGPAFEFPNGAKEWWVNGELHRTDGPAIEYADGTKEWYLNGEKLSEEDFNARMNPIELTLDEIAEKFGVDVSRLKIKK